MQMIEMDAKEIIAPNIFLKLNLSLNIITPTKNEAIKDKNADIGNTIIEYNKLLKEVTKNEIENAVNATNKP